MSEPVRSDRSSEDKPWPFRERWCIRGLLFTETPLSVGSGGIITHPDLNNKDGEMAEIGACFTDHTGRACIPGSTLKGCLAAWLTQHQVAGAAYDRIFGKPPDEASPDDDEDRGLGGCAAFHDARVGLARCDDPPLAHWNRKRQTFIEASTSINRELGSAAVERLIHRECVPAGVGFEVVITGMLNEDSARSDMALLLGLLDYFNDPTSPIRLGADTASGKGRCRWEPCEVSCMDRGQVRAWLDDPNRGMPVHHMKTIPLQASPPGLVKQPESLTFNLTLRFHGPFLVSEPTDKTKIENTPPGSQPDRQPRLDERGRVLLPAKSFRGALRSQAEKILRTMAWSRGEPDESLRHWLHRHIACRPELTGLGCVPLGDDDSPEERLCLACQLFGAPGWKTPLEISDFTWIEGTGRCVSQEFIAIDRFTGGGAGKLKFNVECYEKPHFKGTIAFFRHRLAEDWPLGLLALVLRDLIEGDIALGYGASRGYGSCTAEIDRWQDNEFQTAVEKKGLPELQERINHSLPTAPATAEETHEQIS